MAFVWSMVETTLIIFPSYTLLVRLLLNFRVRCNVRRGFHFQQNNNKKPGGSVASALISSSYMVQQIY
jgi:hypothetical protein